MDIEKDDLFELAERYVENTGVSVFLTGKAGTGKTTFLKYITENTSKRFVVLAPTGVAAINAGGSTIHSFFQLPLCPYLPDVKELITEYQIPDKFRSLRKERIKVIRTLDLLIIDEISMVRADLLDAVDMSLRRYRLSDLPFGGVQLLMVGDTRQLSPVVTDGERPYLSQVYSSPYFFSSKALHKFEYVTIELQTVHRQQEKEFVDILNSIRDGRPTTEMLRRLNTRVGADVKSEDGTEPIRLMTHNRCVNSYNSSQLDSLPGKAVTFTADIEGEFPENSYPTDRCILLKENAQVMFIRNDTSGGGEYFNGKLGKVLSFDGEKSLTVECEGGQRISVSKVEWENTQYIIDGGTGGIRQEKIGSFSQIPLRPAWAVTIHKSQGLTFDRVIIDAKAAFAFGQVYVALSRCRALEGISLESPIRQSSLFSDSSVSGFTESLPDYDTVRHLLPKKESDHYIGRLCSVFDFSATGRYLGWLNKIWREDLQKIYPEKGRELEQCLADLDEILPVTEKFRRQITFICSHSTSCPNDPHLAERLEKASAYFGPLLEKIQSAAECIPGLVIDNKETKKRVREAAGELLTNLKISLRTFSLISSEGFTVKGYSSIRTSCLLEGRERPKVKNERVRNAASVRSEGMDATEEAVPDASLAERLQKWRTDRYLADGVPAYVIMHQKTLMQIAAHKPGTAEELLSIKGFGKAKFGKYGEEILSICKEFKKESQ